MCPPLFSFQPPDQRREGRRGAGWLPSTQAEE